jgi:G3E family GTPase
VRATSKQQTFFVDEDVRRKTKLDAIVTVVDAKHLLSEIDRAHEAQEQLAFADVVLLNKTDLVSGDELATVEARIRQINPYTRIHRTERCDVDLGNVLGRDAFNLNRILTGSASGRIRRAGVFLRLLRRQVLANAPMAASRVAVSCGNALLPLRHARSAASRAWAVMREEDSTG